MCGAVDRDAFWRDSICRACLGEKLLENRVILRQQFDIMLSEESSGGRLTSETFGGSFRELARSRSSVSGSNSKLAQSIIGNVKANSIGDKEFESGVAQRSLAGRQLGLNGDAQRAQNYAEALIDDDSFESDDDTEEESEAYDSDTRETSTAVFQEERLENVEEGEIDDANFKVVVRVRPPLDRELSAINEYRCVVEMDDDDQQLKPSRGITIHEHMVMRQPINKVDSLPYSSYKVYFRPRLRYRKHTAGGVRNICKERSQVSSAGLQRHHHGIWADGNRKNIYNGGHTPWRRERNYSKGDRGHVHVYRK